MKLLFPLFVVLLLISQKGIANSSWNAQCEIDEESKKQVSLFEGCYKFELAVQQGWGKDEIDSEANFQNGEMLRLDMQRMKGSVVGAVLSPKRGETNMICDSHEVTKLISRLKGSYKYNRNKTKEFAIDLFSTNEDGVAYPTLTYNCQISQ